MKDRISRVPPRAVPYILPRRALHSENGTLAGRSVRQATNPACSLPQYLTGIKQFEECNDYIGTVGCVPALRAFYVQIRDPSYRFITCAKVACDNNLPNIRKAEQIPFTFGGSQFERLNDTRCFIAIPPTELTFPLVEDLSHEDTPHRYRNIPGTVAYGVEPVVIGGVGYSGVVHDVDSFRCFAGIRDKTVARQLQQEVGLTAAIGAAAIASCVPASACAATVTAQAATVTGLAVTLGLAGSAAVIGGAAYAGYKFVQYCKTDTQVTPDVTPDVTVDTENTYRNYEDIDLNRIDTNEHIIVAPKPVVDNPFGPRLQNTSQI